MANEKQYLEVFNNGQTDLYIRDQEAQLALQQTNNEVNILKQKMDGPFYSEGGIIFPNYEEAYFNPATGGVYL